MPCLQFFPAPSSQRQTTSAAGAGCWSSLLPHRYSLRFSVPCSPSGLLRPRPRLRVRAVDAAQPYDYETHLLTRFNQSTKLRIAIVGFGNFGQFLGKVFVRQGHAVYVHSRSDYHATAQSIGAVFFSNLHDLCEQHPDMILLCTSILSTESVLRGILSSASGGIPCLLMFFR